MGGKVCWHNIYNIQNNDYENIQNELTPTQSRRLTLETTFGRLLLLAGGGWLASETAPAAEVTSGAEDAPAAAAPIEPTTSAAFWAPEIAGCGVRGDHCEPGGDVSSMPDKRSKFDMPEVTDETEGATEDVAPVAGGTCCGCCFCG